MSTVPGQKIDDVEIKLTVRRVPSAQDKSSTPMASRSDSARRHRAKDAQENRYYVPSVKTGANGKFELHFIRPGEQYIQVTHMTPGVKQAAEKSTVLLNLVEGEKVDGLELVTGGAPALLQVK